MGLAGSGMAARKSICVESSSILRLLDNDGFMIRVEPEL
jgi:hypothetical protein